MGTEQGSRTCNFTSFFELWVESSDHADGRDEADPAELLTNPFALNVESLDAPVACSDGVVKAMSDSAAFCLHKMSYLDDSLVFMLD